MSQHKEAYVISYHGALCHNMLYVATIVASLLPTESTMVTGIVYKANHDQHVHIR